MTTRELPRSEWGRIAALGTGLGRVIDQFPDNVRVVVVEDGTDIVGHAAVLPVWHVEDAWIAEAHRGRASVAKRLREGVLGVTRRFVCGAGTPELARMFAKHFGATPAPPQYLVSVEEGDHA